MFFIFKSKVESTQVATGGSSNYPPGGTPADLICLSLWGSINHQPILADLIYLSRVIHEWQLKSSADLGGSNLSTITMFSANTGSSHTMVSASSGSH